MKNPPREKRVLIFDDEGLGLLGKQLIAVRKQKKYSQEKLALEAGLPLSQIGRIERAVVNPTVSTVFKIARALKVKPSELFDFELSPIKEKP
ncbi:MAG: helix-turn-helix domain-containing protein [Sphingobacteriales bacterium JAD_PAG50586_3]|nr:MAG: helix-turn-helix domain-containing protein [Sphingobacteriales bacterium JAD_PAG50586_3]